MNTEQVLSKKETGGPLKVSALTGWGSSLRPLWIALAVLLLPVLFRMRLANFAPFLDPLVWRFILYGVGTTIGVALVSILLSLPLATAFALGRLSIFPAVRLPSIALIEGIRALPVLLLITYVFKVQTQVGLPSEAYIAAIIALTLYTSVVNGELLRAGILSLDRGQTEAALSLGFNYFQTMGFVILPQAFRRTLPPLIAQFTILLKDTSLAAVVGLLELSKRAQILYQRDQNPLEMLYVAALIYFLLNYLLGRLSDSVRQRVLYGP